MRNSFCVMFVCAVTLLVGCSTRDHSTRAADASHPAAAPLPILRARKITFDQWQQYRAAVEGLPNVKVSIIDRQLVAQSDAEHEFWYFTEPQHPAYPAVVEMLYVQEGSHTVIGSDGHFVDDEGAFDAWYNPFLEANRRLIEYYKLKGTRE